MSTPYQRGTAFEHRVKAELEEAGYLVIRSAGSKSEFDLAAIKRFVDPVWGSPRVLLVQCKLRARLTSRERDDLVALATVIGAKPVWARMLKGPSHLIHYQDLLAGVEFVL